MKEFNIYALVLLIIGIGILAVTWLPRIFKKYPFSYPILFLLFGYIIYNVIPGVPHVDLVHNNDLVLRLTELCVIISLIGSGLKVDPHLKADKWKMTFRLLYLTMILTIAVMTISGVYILGLPLASAILLAAALAPTDPVLATDVQIESPSEDKVDKVKFTLTAEAGLNDGLSFPFVNLAVVLALSAAHDTNWITEWILFDILYKIAVGFIAGYYMGKFLGFIIFKLPEKTRLPQILDGFISLAITFITYGVVEMMHGYGFVAVFFAAYGFRKFESQHKIHDKLHEFNDQIERLFTFILIILLGGAIASGLFNALTIEGVIMGVLLIFVVRPAIGMLSLFKTHSTVKERAFISFFGIRGIGSFFYIAYAFKEADFANKETIWAVIGFTVMLSVIVHGIAVTPAMRNLDLKRLNRLRKKRPVDL